MWAEKGNICVGIGQILSVFKELLWRWGVQTWSCSKEAELKGTICCDECMNNQLHFIGAHSDLDSAKYDAFSQTTNFKYHPLIGH